MFTDPYGKDWYSGTISPTELNEDLYIQDTSYGSLIPYIKCESCGEHLYEGDTYYPELGICGYCLNNYRETVNLEL